MASPYVVTEVNRNLTKLSISATGDWDRLRKQLVLVDDIVSLNLPAVFPASKDRPVLFTALALSEALLTLDREDFVTLLGREFYGLRVRLPYEFLQEERAAGRLKIEKPS